MTNKFSEKANTFLNLHKMSSTALKGKRSVRTSFKLFEGCIHAISIVATKLGIKHRSFDNLDSAIHRFAEDITAFTPAPCTPIY